MARDNDGVEHLKDKLYSRKRKEPAHDVRSPLSESDAHAPVAWEPPPPAMMPSAQKVEGGSTSFTLGGSRPSEGLFFSAKFFLGLLGIFLIAGGGAAFFFFGGGHFVSPNNIDLQIVAPSLVDGGSQV